MTWSIHEIFLGLGDKSILVDSGKGRNDALVDLGLMPLTRRFLVDEVDTG